MPVPRRIVLLGLLVLPACEHTSPFSLDVPERLGPADGLPVRLTFNPAEDRDPSTVGDTVVFSRLEPGRDDLDRCIALLPAAGGTLFHVACPGGDRSDDQLDAWLQPTVTGARVAYLRQRSRIGVIAPAYRDIIVASLSRPDRPTAQFPVRFTVTGASAYDVRGLRWRDEDKLVFVAGQDSFPGMGSARDTLFNPLALVELHVGTGDLRIIPGTQRVASYWLSDDGSIWFVRSDDSAVLRRIEAGSDTSVVAGAFSQQVVAVAVVGGSPTGLYGLRLPSGNVWVLERIDTESGEPADTIMFSGVARHMVPIGSTRSVIVEVRGSGSWDLWRVDLP